MNEGVGGETKTRILDAAERIFARDGFDAASLRTITTEAHANLAAVNYHFQTKEALFTAVIGRRLGPINERRHQMLDELGAHLSVEGIVEAFLRPPFENTAVKREVLRPLMARLSGVPDEMMIRIYRAHLEPMLQRFVSALARVLPGVPRAELRLRMFFMVGSMAQAMAWSSLLPKLTDSGPEVTDLVERLVAFATAGLQAPYDAAQLKESRQRKQNETLSPIACAAPMHGGRGRRRAGARADAAPRG